MKKVTIVLPYFNHRSACEGVQLTAHHFLKRSKDFVAGTMAGVKLRMGIGLYQPTAQAHKFIIIPIKQMETADNSMNRMRTSSKNILQAAMSTTRKEQTVCV